MKYSDVDLLLENEILRKLILSKIHTEELSLHKICSLCRIQIPKVEGWLEKKTFMLNHLELQAVCKAVGLDVMVSIEERELTHNERVRVSSPNKILTNTRPQFYDE